LPQETAKVQTLVEGGSDKQAKDATMIILDTNVAAANATTPVQGLAQATAGAGANGVT